MRRCSVTIGLSLGAVSGSDFAVSILHKFLDISCKDVLYLIKCGGPQNARGRRGFKPRLPGESLTVQTAPTSGDSDICLAHFDEEEFDYANTRIQRKT